MPKYLIVDKSILYSLSADTCTRAGRLRQFVETHNVILSETLFYECVTTDRQKEVVLDRCREAVLAGGIVLPTLRAIVQTEAADLQPYGPLVGTYYGGVVRRTFEEDARPYDVELAQRRCQEDKAFSMDVVENVGALIARMDSEASHTLAGLRRCDASRQSRPSRLMEWAELVDSRDIHRMANILLEGSTSCPERYCLSREWITWHVVRLFWIWFYECAFQRANGGQTTQTRVEHDWQDMTYIALLSRADGFVTADTFAHELARAAFPEKEVFSSLNEVRDSYRSDRVNG